VLTTIRATLGRLRNWAADKLLPELAAERDELAEDLARVHLENMFLTQAGASQLESDQSQLGGMRQLIAALLLRQGSEVTFSIDLFESAENLGYAIDADKTTNTARVFVVPLTSEEAN
jgi:hypothetical protein